MSSARIILLFTAVLLQLNNSIAQDVQSGAYNLLLKALLAHSVHEVDVAHANAAESRVFVDARELEEYKVSHIKGAVWAGYNDFSIDRLKDISKDDKVTVYCSIGKRSEDIAMKMQQAGYKEVSNLYGGIFEWINEGYPVYDKKGKTNRVHAYSKTWGIWLNKGDKVYNTNNN